MFPELLTCIKQLKQIKVKSIRQKKIYYIKSNSTEEFTPRTLDIDKSNGKQQYDDMQ